MSKTDEQAEEARRELSFKLLVFNMYIPCDTECDEVNLCTCQDVLNEVKFFMSSHEGKVILLFFGDLMLADGICQILLLYKKSVKMSLYSFAL